MDRPLRFTKNEGVEASKDGPEARRRKAVHASASASIFPKAEQSYTIAAHNNPKDKNRGWMIDVGARVPGLRITGDGGAAIEIRAAHLQQLQHGSWNNLVVYLRRLAAAIRPEHLSQRHASIPTQGRGDQNVESVRRYRGG